MIKLSRNLVLTSKKFSKGTNFLSFFNLQDEVEVTRMLEIII